MDKGALMKKKPLKFTNLSKAKCGTKHINNICINHNQWRFCPNGTGQIKTQLDILILNIFQKKINNDCQMSEKNTHFDKRSIKILFDSSCQTSKRSVSIVPP